MAYFINESLSDSEFTAPLNVPGTFGGTPRRIESITIHHWGSFGQTGPEVLNFFVNRNPNTSAHFVVWDGNIYCLVSPANAAWAAGNAYGNATSIHIECHPEATPGDYATVAWLVRWLREQYGSGLPLVPHNQWTATACPGIWDLKRLDRLARTPEPAATPTPPTAKETDMLIISKDKGSADVWIGNGITRRRIPDAKTLEDYRKLARWKVLSIFRDGETMDYPVAVLGEPVK